MKFPQLSEQNQYISLVTIHMITMWFTPSLSIIKLTSYLLHLDHELAGYEIELRSESVGI